MNQMGKRIISVLLLICMLVGNMPLEALAANVGGKEHSHVALLSPDDLPSPTACDCHVEEGPHKPGCQTLKATGECTCTAVGDNHQSTCIVYCDCDANKVASATHQPGCAWLKAKMGCACTLNTDTDHLPTCIMSCNCTANKELTATHQAGCTYLVANGDCTCTEGPADNHMPGCKVLKADGSCTCTEVSSTHQATCPKSCTCGHPGDPELDNHKFGCVYFTARTDCQCTQLSDEHMPGCPILKESDGCTCSAVSTSHMPGCAYLKTNSGCECTDLQTNYQHQPTCSLSCTCGQENEKDSEQHKPGCIYFKASHNCQCTVVGEEHQASCPYSCDCEGGHEVEAVHKPGCRYLKASQNCKCGLYTDFSHRDGCPLHEANCDCGAAERGDNNHTASCATHICTCGAGRSAAIHDPNCYWSDAYGTTNLTLQDLINWYVDHNMAADKDVVINWNGNDVYENIIVPRDYNKSLTIDLGGKSLHPAADSSPSAITDNVKVYGNLTIQNGTLSGTTSAGDPMTNVRGVLVSNGGKFTLGHNAEVCNYSVNSSGGGIRADKDASLTICASASIHNNSARDLGGGVYVYDGKLLTLDHEENAAAANGVITIRDNTASYGGGIALFSLNLYDKNAASREESLGDFSNLTLTGNHATVGGGGLYISEEAYFTSENLRLQNNTAGDKGGGMYLASNFDVILHDPVFTGNVANGTAGYGGAAYFGSSTSGTTKLTIHNPSITDNYASNAGAMHFQSPVQLLAIYADDSITDVTAANKQISRNNATAGAGGALRFAGAVTEFTIRNIVMDSNNTARDGGALYTNSAMGLTMDQITVTNNTGFGQGGAFRIGNSGTNKVILNSGLFQNNKVYSHNSGSEAYGGALYVSGGYFYMNGGTIDQNTAANYGGGIFRSGGTSYFYSGTISNNRATGTDGGAVYVDGSGTVTIGYDKNNLPEGMTEDTLPPALVVKGNYAARYTSGWRQGSGTLTIYDVVMTENLKPGNVNYGGLGACLSGGGTTKIYGGEYYNNEAQVIADWSGTIYLYGGHIHDNKGVGVYVFGGTTYMENYESGLKDENGDDCGGAWIHNNADGGIYTHEGTVVMNGGTISNNSGYGIGGNARPVTMTGGVIRDNTGRGITISASWNRDSNTTYWKGSVTMSGGLITRNGGGGVTAGIVNMTGGSIVNNGSGAKEFNGGGINAHEVNMSGGTVTGNTATYGGGIYGGAGTVTRLAATDGGYYMIGEIRSKINITGGSLQDNYARYLGNDVFVTKPENGNLQEEIGTASDGSGKTIHTTSFFMEDSDKMKVPGKTYSHAVLKAELAAQGDNSYYTAWKDEIASADGTPVLVETFMSERRHPTTEQVWEAYTFTTESPEPVAMIDDVPFTTLQAAFDYLKQVQDAYNANPNKEIMDKPASTIKMVRTTTENVVVPAGIDGRLNLNGINVKCTKGTVLTMNSASKLIICDFDSAGTGMISGGTTSGIVLSNGADLTIESGRICNNGNFDTNGSGGGVRVEDGGILRVTNNAIIANNSAPMPNTAPNYFSGGGGVSVAAGGKMFMTGGTIEKNAVAPMTNITGATADSAGGGGVYVKAGGEFTMSGGTITGNEATKFDGAGVLVRGGTFTMTDGTISNNKAGQSNTGVTWGGGVGVADPTGVFNMSGGTITGNLGNSGGGVIIWNAGTFNMSGGSITKNTANGLSIGGGVYVHANDIRDASNNLLKSTFNMSGGEISENVANAGGGVELRYQNAVMNMSGGTIRDNVARTSTGGGINLYVGDSTTANMTMSGGTITGNTSVGNGGGIYLGHNGIFDLSGSGTLVYNNKANTQEGNDIYFHVTGANSATVSKLANIGAMHVAIPDADGNPTENYYDCWHNDTNGTDYLSSSTLADIAADVGWTQSGESYKVSTAIGLTANVAVDVPDPGTESVAYYIPADAEGPAGYIKFSSLQAAVNAVSDSETTTTEKPVPSGGTIYLMSDKIAENVTVPAATFVLDMNGYTVIGAMPQKPILELTTGANVTIRDTESAEQWMHCTAEGAVGTLKLAPEFPTGQGIHVNSGASLTVDKCTLTGFSLATKNGSAIGNEGGSVTLNAGTVIRNNEYVGTGYGGAVYTGSSGTTVVNGGEYSYNRSDLNGGAFAVASPATVTVNGGTFQNNEALNGGVFNVANSDAKLTINGGLFTKNKATGTDTSDSNSRSGMGGVIYTKSVSEACKTEITGGTFTENTAANGGVVYGHYSFMEVKQATGSELKFTKNNATYGGVFFWGDNTNGGNTNKKLTIESGLFEENTASTGGVVYIHSGTLSISGGNFQKNNTTGAGGVIYRYGWDDNWIILNISGGTFAYNKTTRSSGGAIYSVSGTVRLSGATDMHHNTAYFDGGAIYGGTTMKDSVTIHENSAGRYGGAIYGGVTMGVENETSHNPQIFKNTAATGGAIHGSLAMHSGAIKENTATGGGGALYLNAYNTMTMNGGEISKNNAGSNGGAVHTGYWVTINMNGGKIKDNVAGGSGGAIYLYMYTMNMNGGEISGNRAGSNGGGIWAWSQWNNNAMNVNLRGGEIRDNYAGGNGGGVWYTSTYSLGYLRLYGTVKITGNRAGGNGGGIYMDSAGTKANADAERSKTEFNIGMYSHADYPGRGAVYGNSAALGQDLYTVAGAEDDIMKATDMTLPASWVVNGWLDETTQEVYTSELHGVTTRFYPLTLSYKPTDVVAVMQKNDGTIVEFTSIQDAVTEAMAHPADYKKLDAGDNGTSIVIVKNTVENVVIPAGANISLNLNHHTLGGQGTTLVVQGTLKIRDQLMDETNYPNFAKHDPADDSKLIYGPGPANKEGTISGGASKPNTTTGSTSTDPSLGKGGAIRVSNGGNATMFGGVITDSKASVGGNAVYVVNGTFTMDSAKDANGNVLTTAKILNNKGTNGTAVYLESTAANFNMRDGEIAGNSDGKADNQALIYNNKGNVSISGGRIHDNNCTSIIYNTGSDTDGRTMISGGVFENNTVRRGVVYSANGVVVVQGNGVKNPVIRNNTSSINGAAMYIANGKVNISNASITGNKALTTTSGSGLGGAIYQSGGNLTIDEGTILSDNEAANRGGAIYRAGGTATILGGSIVNNKAARGGGIAQTAQGINITTNVASGAKIYENVATMTNSGNDIYSAYEGDPNKIPSIQDWSTITLEAVVDMGEQSRYNVWKNDADETGVYTKPVDTIQEGMYVRNIIDKGSNLQLTTTYFDMRETPEKLDDGYTISSMTLEMNLSGKYPDKKDSAGQIIPKTNYKTPVQMGWAMDPVHKYVDEVTGETMNYYINPNNGNLVKPDEKLAQLSTEKTALEKGLPQATETYQTATGEIKHYRRGTDGKLYEEEQMVEWTPGDDTYQKNTLILTYDTAGYGLTLGIHKKGEETGSGDGTGTGSGTGEGSGTGTGTGTGTGGGSGTGEGGEPTPESKVRVNIEIELDCNMNQAKLSLPDMRMMVDGKAVGDDLFRGVVVMVEDENGGMKQVVRGYCDVTIKDAATLGGNFSLTVKDMVNGETLKPRVKTWVQGDLDEIKNDQGQVIPDPVTGEPLTQKHVLERATERLTVSATGRYNLTLRQNSALCMEDYFDLSTGQRSSEAAFNTQGANGRIVNGFMMGYGVTVSLYPDPDDPAKGIMGVELPRDYLTFNLDMKAEIFFEGEKLMDGDKPAIMVPVLWAYKENELGKIGRGEGQTVGSMNMDWNDEDDLDKRTAYAFNAAPFNSGNNAKGVYNGGGWQVTTGTGADDETQLNIRVNGYTFDFSGSSDMNPTSTSNGAISDFFGPNIAKAFSAGYIQVIYPKPTREYIYDRITAQQRADYPSGGEYTLNCKSVVADLDIKTKSGEEPESSPLLESMKGYFGEDTGNHATCEMHYSDNYHAASNKSSVSFDEPGLPGSIFSSVIFYKQKTGTNAYQDFPNSEAGEAATPLGSFVGIGTRNTFSSMAYNTVDQTLADGRTNAYYVPPECYNAQQFAKTEYDYMTAFNSLQKFDADVFTPVGNAVNQRITGKSTVNNSVYVETNEEAPDWSATNNHTNPTTSMDLRVLYAAKPDGTNWEKVTVSAWEIFNHPTDYSFEIIKAKDGQTPAAIKYEGIEYSLGTMHVGATNEDDSDIVLSDGGTADMAKYHEEQLIYFETLDDLKNWFKDTGRNADAKCVAVLFEARDMVIRSGHYVEFDVLGDITTDFDYTGRTYATTADMRSWKTYRPVYKTFRNDPHDSRMEHLYTFSWSSVSYDGKEGSKAMGMGLAYDESTKNNNTYVTGLQNSSVNYSPDTVEKYTYPVRSRTDANGNPLKDDAGNILTHHVTEVLQVPVTSNYYIFSSVYTRPGRSPVRTYAKTEYSYGSHRGNTHSNWIYGNSILLHTLEAGIEIGVNDKISLSSNTPKRTYNLSVGENTPSFVITPTLKKSSVVSNALVSDGGQSTRMNIEMILPAGMTYNKGSLTFDYTDKVIDNKAQPTYKENELNWSVGEPVVQPDGTTIIIISTDVPDVTAWSATENKYVQKHLPNLIFSGTIDPGTNSSTMTIQTRIEAIYEEHNSLAAYPKTGNATIILEKSNLTGLYHDLLTLKDTDERPYNNLIEIGEDFGYELTFYKRDTGTMENVTLVDVLPYNGDSRNDANAFHGGYDVKKVEVTFTGPHAHDAALNYGDKGGLIYGGVSKSAEKKAREDETPMITLDDKQVNAYKSMMTEEYNYAGPLEQVIRDRTNAVTVRSELKTRGEGDAAVYYYEYNMANLNLSGLVEAVAAKVATTDVDKLDSILKRELVGEDGTTTYVAKTGDELTAAINQLISDKMGKTADELAAMTHLRTLSTDTVGHQFYVQQPTMPGDGTNIKVNMILNGAETVNGVVQTIKSGDDDIGQNGGDSYSNSFGATSGSASLPSQKGAIKVVKRDFSGYAFLDMDNCGRFVSDPEYKDSHKKLPGIKVNLFKYVDGEYEPAKDALGNKYPQKVTDANGNYIFENIRAGEYIAVFTCDGDTVIDGKLPFKKMSVTSLAGDDGNPSTTDFFETASAVNRCVAIYDFEDNGLPTPNTPTAPENGDSGNGTMSTLSAINPEYSFQMLSGTGNGGIMLLANDDPAEPTEPAPDTNRDGMSMHLKQGQLYARVSLPTKGDMDTSTYSCTDNNFGIYCIEAQVEKKWENMVEQVPAGLSVDINVKGKTGESTPTILFDGNVKFTQQSVWNNVEVTSNGIQFKDNAPVKTIASQPTTLNTKVDHVDYTWNAKTFYLTPKYWSGSESKLVNYYHEENLTYTGSESWVLTKDENNENVMRGYDVRQKEIERKKDGVTIFRVTNTQRNQEIVLKKVNYNNVNQPLAGAKFRVTDGTKVLKFYKISDGVYQRIPDNVTLKDADIITALETDKSGKLTIRGLPETAEFVADATTGENVPSTYRGLYLEEVKAPKRASGLDSFYEGFLKASGQWPLSIANETKGQIRENVARAGYGKANGFDAKPAVLMDESLMRYQLASDMDKLSMLYHPESTESLDAAGNPKVDTEHQFWIPNVPGFRLPFTGGEGTAPILVTGLAAAAAGVFLLLEYQRRRRKTQNNA